jgi:hypothetical protein
VCTDPKHTLNRGSTGPGGCLCREDLYRGCAAQLRGIVPKCVPRARSERRGGLPESLGTSTMRILAPVGSYERQDAACTAFPFTACSWAPGCKIAGASSTYSEGAGPPSRLGKGVTETRCSRRNLRAQTGRLHHSLYHAEQGNKDYNTPPLGIAA